MKKNFTPFIAIVVLCCLCVMNSCTKAILDNKEETPNLDNPNAVDSLKIGLIAYYPFNNSSADESGNNYNGTAYNTVVTNDRNGKANSAYYFNGTNSYVQVADNKALRLNGTDFTINCWVKLDQYNPSNGSFIVSKRTTGNASGWGFSITNYSASNNIVTKGLLFFGPGGNDPYGLGTKILALNTWYMVSSVYSASKQQVSFYINGVLDNISNGVASPNSAIIGDMYIGSDNFLTNSNYNFKGTLDELSIYKRVLTIAELQKLYTSTY